MSFASMQRRAKRHCQSLLSRCRSYLSRSGDFEVERFDPGKELDRQSGIYLRPPGSRVV
jgi:hypothetical protein